MGRRAGKPMRTEKTSEAQYRAILKWRRNHRDKVREYNNVQKARKEAEEAEREEEITRQINELNSIIERLKLEQDDLNYRLLMSNPVDSPKPENISSSS